MPRGGVEPAQPSPRPVRAVPDAAGNGAAHDEQPARQNPFARRAAAPRPPAAQAAEPAEAPDPFSSPLPALPAGYPIVRASRRPAPTAELPQVDVPDRDPGEYAARGTGVQSVQAQLAQLQQSGGAEQRTRQQEERAPRTPGVLRAAAPPQQEGRRAARDAEAVGAGWPGELDPGQGPHREPADAAGHAPGHTGWPVQPEGLDYSRGEGLGHAPETHPAADGPGDHVARAEAARAKGEQFARARAETARAEEELARARVEAPAVAPAEAPVEAPAEPPRAEPKARVETRPAKPVVKPAPKPAAEPVPDPGQPKHRQPSTSEGLPSPSRVFSRIARLGSSNRSTTSPLLEPLLRTVRVSHPKADLSVIERAFEVAAKAHAGQKRKSGDPYITHPVAVSGILAELGMTPATLAAALLHDTVEDTSYTLEALRDDFGDEVAMLVDGVTKLDKVKYGDAAQAETVRKMVVAMSKDIRVLVIKLCDRLHNARTWKYVPPHKAEKKAKETLEIYAPLAHRLGMNTIKWELEDLSFATLYPKVYEEIVRLVAERAPAREDYLAQVREQVSADLRAAKIKATTTGRPKHYYSVYQKMIVRGRDFADIYDLVGVRVLVESVRDCYAVLGALHARWNPVPGRFKDYIAMPKFNMYQSLHTTVIGPEGKPVEIQIRTHQMHRRAEYGVAAHWKYKDDLSSPNPDGANDMAWLRQLLDWQRETADPGEFLDSLRFEINAQEVYVFTPKGDVVALPSESTPVDFAYAVHTEVGHRCMGARVNGRLVPLESRLDNGDVVEVFTSKTDAAGPSRDWLTFVRSARARNKIRQWFSKERREEAIESGKDAIAKEMRKKHLPMQRMMSHEALVTLATEMRFLDVSGLYAAVGEGHATAASVVQRLVDALGGEAGAEEDFAETLSPMRPRRPRMGDPGVVVKGVDDVWVKLARCCTPVPGDPIIGFVTRGSGVSVHREDCGNVVELLSEPDRIVDVEWAPTSASVFLVQIQVEALDRNRLLSDVTRVLSDHHVNILAANVATSRDRMAISKFTFEMADPAHLGHVIAAVRRVDGVFDAYRTTGKRGEV